jgi:hypothetical protein
LRELAEDLLLLPDTADPVRWLREERGESVARRLLWAVLELLRSEYPGVSRSNRYDDLQPQQKAHLDAIDAMWLPEALLENPFAGLDEMTEVPALSEFFHGIRRLRPRYIAPGKTMPDGDLPALAEDVWTLPSDGDVISWLRTERSDLAAILTLRDVLRLRSPPVATLPELWRDRHLVNQSIELPGRARFNVEEVRVGPVGFAAEVVVRTFGDDLTTGRPAALLMWDGLDEVVDNRGNYYLIEESATGIASEGDVVRHHFAFRPALPQGATVITFRATPARFVITGKFVPGTRFMAYVSAGDMSWQVSIARSPGSR